MKYQQEYERWRRRATDDETQAELRAIAGDPQAQRERFAGELAFGTAGLRGILGAGRNRMNIYVVRRTTQGLAEYVLARYGEGAVAIAYDSRHKSELFARECAAVLAGNGVTALLYDRLMPTPMLSFAVRDLGAQAGIMITASHNPAQYNGYKVYGSDGCQMTLEDTRTVSARIDELDYFNGIERMDFEAGLKQGLIKYIDKKTVERYYAAVEAQQLNPGICRRYPVKVLYSPLNGAGNEAVGQVLADIGVHDLAVVPEQERPDGDFPTCPYPNPETREALALGLAMCERGRADIFIATDPDADRVGVAFKDGEGYRILSGNEVGVLLLYYIMQARAENKSMPARPVAVRSVVSSALADDIAREGGVEMITVLTGFKFIGEQILLLEQQGEEARFLFGFEESCGYLAGSYVRDKDAVVACMLLCEMTSWCRMKNLPPTVLLDRIYQKFGYYRNGVVNLEFPGPDGIAEMQALMNGLFDNPPQDLAGHQIVSVSDFRRGVRVSLTLDVETPIPLPAADMVGFRFENGATVLVRPSGTEPKMKIYITAKENSAEASEALVAELVQAATALLQGRKK